METIAGLIPWLLGGVALLAGGFWLHNNGKLSEWFPNVFGKQAAPTLSSDDPNKAGQKVKSRIRVVKDGEPIAPETSLVLTPENGIVFSGENKEGLVQAMRYLEQPAAQPLTVVTGRAAGTGRFQITSIATSSIENGAPVSRRLRYSLGDREEIAIGDDGILDLDSQEAKDRLQRLRGDPALSRGRPTAVIVKQEIPGNPTSIVLDGEGRVAYITYTTRHAEQLASRLDGPATIVTGDPDPDDPTIFRVNRFATKAHLDHNTTEMRSVSFPGGNRPALPIEKGGINFLRIDVIRELGELRKLIDQKHDAINPSSTEYLGHGLETKPNALMSSLTLAKR
jgi:hypothetical protein